MGAALAAVIDLVARSGMERDRAENIAEYIADRCAGLSLTTVHSSGHSALRRDGYLVGQMGLRPRQIGAWLALVRGTRTARGRNGRVAGGFPGLPEACASGRIPPESRRRYERLAFVAAHGHPQRPCAAQSPHPASSRR